MVIPMLGRLHQFVLTGDVPQPHEADVIDLPVPRAGDDEEERGPVRLKGMPVTALEALGRFRESA